MSTILTKISAYINQGEEIRAKYPNIWQPKYDNDLATLKEIANKASIDESAARHMFYLTEISKFQTFGAYVQS